MRHVYFHCSTGDSLLLDARGTDVEDLIEAHQCAAQVVTQFVNSHGPDDWRTWTLLVSDEEGDELFLMPFTYVIGRLH